MKNIFLISLLCAFACTVKNPVKTIEKTPVEVPPSAAVYRHAGIEIGSTGVKFTIIDLYREKSKTDNLPYYAYVKIEELSSNTRFIDFTSNTDKATATAVEEFYKIASKSYNIPNVSIYICVSHGVVTQAMKRDNSLNKNQCLTLSNLKKRIWEKIPDYKKGCIGLLDENEEPELTHIGIIPLEIQEDVSLIDIGGGNTKGGYFLFNPERKFVPFEVEEGVRSLSNRAKQGLRVDEFHKYVKRVEMIVNDSLEAEIRSIASDIRKKSDIILTGGICWAVASITDSADNKDMQRITLNDVTQVIEIVTNDKKFKALEAKSKLLKNKELKRVLDAFNQDLLIAGSFLLKKMMEEIKRNQEEHRFYVYKASYVGWLKGYIIVSISERVTASKTGYRSVCGDQDDSQTR